MTIPVGRHQISFAHPQYGTRDTTVTISEGESVTLMCYFEAYVSANMANENNDLTTGTWVIDGDTLSGSRYRTLRRYPLSVGEHRIQAGKFGQFTEPRLVVVEPSFQEQNLRLPSFRVSTQ